MKKILLVVFMLILSGCSILDNEKIKILEKENIKLKSEIENLKQISNQNKTENIFKKNKECASLNDEILKEINKSYKKGDPVLEQVFYSSERVSCLYVFRYSEFQFFGGDCNSDSKSFGDLVNYCIVKNKMIVDFFTKEIVAEQPNEALRNCKDKCGIYEKKYEKYNKILERLKK